MKSPLRKLPKKNVQLNVQKKSKAKINKKGSSQRRSFFIKSNKNVDPTFNSRKEDHLVLSLDNRTQNGAWPQITTAQNLTADGSVQISKQRFLDRVQIAATAFPEINFDDVNIETQFHGRRLSAPFFISSMTSGTSMGEPINEALAELSHEKQILMGVGSQRKELQSDSAMKEWQRLRKKYPKALFLSNLGLSQLIATPIERIQAIVENLQAVGLIIHCNALQECLQKEGTPQFRGGLEAISRLVNTLKIPVIVKEVGFGFSQKDLVRLNNLGVFAVDFAGRGGTNWAHIEALRYPKNSIGQQTGFVFSDWGYDIQEWIGFHDQDTVSYQFWSSGGIRNGLDVAKMIAIGAHQVGMAQPWLKSLLVDANLKKLSVERLFEFYDKTARELKIALFCSGNTSLDLLRNNKVYYVK